MKSQLAIEHPLSTRFVVFVYEDKVIAEVVDIVRADSVESVVLGCCCELECDACCRV